MKSRKSLWAKAVMLCLGAVLLTAGKGTPKVGEVAPPFELTMIDGTKINSDQLRGQVVVLNFWATWCVPCRKELPLLDSYYEAQKKAGLTVVAIATEDSLPTYQLRKLFAVMHMPSAKKIKGKYPILTGVPTNYVIDRAGRIRYAKSGSFDLNDLNSVLVPLLREPAPAAPPAPAL